MYSDKPGATNVDVKQKPFFLACCRDSFLYAIVYICSSSYLGGHVVGVMNHHRTGEVFVEVIYIFTHPGTKWKKTQTGADCNVLIRVQSRASSGDKNRSCSYRLLRLPDTQM